MPGSCGNEGKKNSDNGFPCLNSLARLVGKTTTPSGLYRPPTRLIGERSADLEGRVNANNIAVFQLSCFRERDSVSPHEVICVSTACTFHLLFYRDTGGLSLKTPLINLVTKGC